MEHEGHPEGRERAYGNAVALSDGSDGIFLIGRQRLKPHIGRIADHHVERWIGRKPKKIRDDDIRGAP